MGKTITLFNQSILSLRRGMFTSSVQAARHMGSLKFNGGANIPYLNNSILINNRWSEGIANRMYLMSMRTNQLFYKILDVSPDLAQQFITSQREGNIDNCIEILKAIDLNATMPNSVPFENRIEYREFVKEFIDQIIFFVEIGEANLGIFKTIENNLNLLKLQYKIEVSNLATESSLSFTDRIQEATKNLYKIWLDIFIKIFATGDVDKETSLLKPVFGWRDLEPRRPVETGEKIINRLLYESFEYLYKNKIVSKETRFFIMYTYFTSRSVCAYFDELPSVGRKIVLKPSELENIIKLRFLIKDFVEVKNKLIICYDKYKNDDPYSNIRYLISLIKAASGALIKLLKFVALVYSTKYAYEKYIEAVKIQESALVKIKDLVENIFTNSLGPTKEELKDNSAINNYSDVILDLNNIIKLISDEIRALKEKQENDHSSIEQDILLLEEHNNNYNVTEYFRWLLPILGFKNKWNLMQDIKVTEGDMSNRQSRIDYLENNINTLAELDVNREKAQINVLVGPIMDEFQSINELKDILELLKKYYYQPPTIHTFFDKIVNRIKLLDEEIVRIKKNKMKLPNQ